MVETEIAYDPAKDADPGEAGGPTSAAPRASMGGCLAALERLNANPDADDLSAALASVQVMAKALGEIDRACLREGLIKRLDDLGCSSPAKLTDATLAQTCPPKLGKGAALHLEAPEPWPDPVDGAELLDEARAEFSRFIVLPEHADIVATLWSLFSYTFDFGDTCPFLLISSPEKRCGKTRLLSVLEGLVRKPLPASNVSPAALFRAIDAFLPTMVLDEADAFLKDNEDLRGLLNSGHTRSAAFVLRVEGDDHEPRQFSTWGPKIIAGIGKPAPTLLDRSIEISLRRKTPGESVQRLRPPAFRLAMTDWRRRVVRWISDNEEALRSADPPIPSGLDDRASDNWTPLLAIAELCGREWLDLATAAAGGLAGAGEDGDGLGVLLLRDIRGIFYGGDETATGSPCVDKIGSEELLSALGKMDERPWPDFRKGKPINGRGLASLLRPFGISRTTIRVGDGTAKGYRLEDFEEAWGRYATPPSAQTPLSVRSQGNKPIEIGISFQNAEVTEEGLLPHENGTKPLQNKRCYPVTDRNPLHDEGGGCDRTDGPSPAELAASEAAAYRRHRTGLTPLNGAQPEPGKGEFEQDELPL